MIKTLSILMLLQLCGELLARLLHLPLPGPLIGMMLLFAGLLGRGQMSQELQQTSQTLLQNLMLLFIPLIAGIMVQFGHVRSQWLPFIAACVIGAVLTLVVTAWTLQWMLGRQHQHQSRAHGN